MNDTTRPQKPDNQIHRKIFLFFVFLGLVEMGLIYKPITLFLQNRVPFKAILNFEVILAPITFFILSLYIFKFLKWDGLTAKIYSAGYWSAILVTFLALLDDFRMVENIFLKEIQHQIFSLFKVIMTPLMEIGRLITSYSGWSVWTHMSLTAYFTGFILFPFATGLIVTGIYLLIRTILDELTNNVK